MRPPTFDLEKERFVPLLAPTCMTVASFLEMPLSQFARERAPIHLTETLWFVPVEADTRLFEAEGVRQVRIWTAIELRELMSRPGLTAEDAISIARVRLAFDATAVGCGSLEGPVEPAAGLSRCYACHGTRWWRSALRGHRTCATCHPPADPALVAEWIDADGVTSEDDR